MQNLEQKNLNFLSRYFPGLMTQFNNKQFQSLDLGLEYSPAKSGAVTAAVSGKYIHSRYDPVEEAGRWAEQNTPPPQAVAVILGWGLGYYAVEWIKKYGKKADAVIIIEPEPRLFIESLKHQDFMQLTNASRVEFVLGMKGEDIFAALNQFLESILCKDLQIIPTPFVDIYPEEFVNILKEQVRRIVDVREEALGHMSRMGYLCQKNIIRNIPHIVQSWYPRDIANMAKGQPAVIAAAGPSLNKTLPHLSLAVDTTLILAVDTAYKILQKHGIEPAILVSKDPTELNLAHFEEIKTVEGSVLAFDPQVPPQIPHRFLASKICLPHRNPDFTHHLPGLEVTPQDTLGLSTNAGIAAYDLAVKLGCEPIIFVGLDLCFSDPAGKSHADGSALQSEAKVVVGQNQMRYKRGEIEDTAEVVFVEGIDGNTYPTLPTFFEAKNALEARIRERSGTVVDASEGGAKIDGAEILAFVEAIEKYGKPVNTHLFQQKTVPTRDADRIKKSMHEIGEWLETCSALAQKGLASLEREGWKEEAAAARKDIETDYKLYHVLHSALERLLVEISRPSFWDEAGEEESKARYRLYFGQIQHACDTFAEMYKEMGELIP